ncbi:phage tail protein [Clostridium pasteurianum]|uniref:phage tail protein n=1 Tax=Clostridium pasteurianum TaxID=1501 RepID=UPI0005A066AD|nr:phage tail protein [Clostridium pasteurianum]
MLLSTEIMQNGKVYKEVECESELGYLNDSRVRAWDIIAISCTDFMQKVIDNHNAHVLPDKQFTLGTVDVPGTITCSTQFENSLNCLIDKMVNTLKVGYLCVRTTDNIRYLDYLQQLPGQSDDIILTKNMKDHNFSEDRTNTATRVIVSGKNNLTIESVNSGKDYLENTEAVNAGYGYIEQYLQFSDIDDPNVLLQKAQDAVEKINVPVYKLTNNILDLSTLELDPHGFHEGTDTTIRIPFLGFLETFPILQIDKDLLNPQNTQITLDNKFENLTDRQLSLQRVAQYMNTVFTEDKKLNGFYLRGYVDLLKTQMGAMADSAEKQQAKAILFEDKIPDSPTYGAMALGTQGFMIASEIVDGEWDWRTFGTGKGFVADLIIAGHLLGGSVDFDLTQGILKITHSDTTYSIFSADGVKRVINGVEYDYTCLAYTGVAIIPDTATSITIQLPNRFKNKSFTATAQAASLQNLADGFALKTYEVGVSGYDYPNARFSIDGTCQAIQISNPSNVPKIDFGITFMVIA